MTDKFAPGWILTTCVSMALGVLLWLGFWQLDRLEEKSAFLAQIETSLSGEPIAFSGYAENPQEWEYKKVEVIGRLEQPNPFCVVGRNFGNELGVFRFVPIILEGGQSLLVNFGWSTFEDNGQISCEPYHRNNVNVKLIGLLRTMNPPNMFIPKPNLAGRVWYSLDLESIQSVIAKEKLLPVMLDNVLIIGEHDDVGVAPYMPLSVPNDHLQYALTWFGLAIMLIGVYVAFGLQRARKKQ